MSCRVIFLAALTLSGCVAATTTGGRSAEPANDERQIRITVKSTGTYSPERVIAATQPMADETCARRGSSAEFIVSKRISPEIEQVSYICR